MISIIASNSICLNRDFKVTTAINVLIIFLSILVGSAFLSGAGVLNYDVWFSAPAAISKLVVIIATFCFFVFSALKLYRMLKK